MGYFSRIVSAERFKGGLLIEFEDGLCGFYSMSLLREVFPRTIAIAAVKPEPDDPEGRMPRT